MSLILDLLSEGSSSADILRDYPQLEEADIKACLAYGAEMSRERFVDVPLDVYLEKDKFYTAQFRRSTNVGGS